MESSLHNIIGYIILAILISVMLYFSGGVLLIWQFTKFIAIVTLIVLFIIFVLKLILEE